MSNARVHQVWKWQQWKFSTKTAYKVRPAASGRTQDLWHSFQYGPPGRQITYMNSGLKGAEHSFRARSCWCDSARAQGLQKQTCRWYSDHFIFSMPSPSLLFLFVIERSVLMALVFYINKGIQGRMQKIQKEGPESHILLTLRRAQSQLQVFLLPANSLRVGRNYPN